ncbi:MAG TPA: 2-oxoglutarate dehydrogenase complex dihydrolipoyllysine-residue succinyltransferase [Polyangia bacterium]|jgi:2-oxoglutarate dehydrogenase E2 component (dihydrolipoamide succinyltransferase)|nr:2-oxoglutarate dehydrogenase complex dihydrolipoyllysine-residue succinyltransferase [Polyangia bacterium]
MSLSLKVPTIGESITEATLGAWKRAEGDYVSVDEPLVEVESEKATFEVPSPGAGILRKILRKAGDTVTVGEIIAEIEPGARDAAAPGQGAGAEAPAPAGNGNGRPTAASPPAQAGADAEAAPGDGNPLRAPPSARRLLAETGIAPSEVKGSGRGGRISKQDVVRALEERDEKDVVAARPPAAPSPSPSPPAPAPIAVLDAARERVVPMTPLRKTVAKRLIEAQQTAAILTTFNEVDMGKVLALRERFQERFQKQHGVKLGFMSFFVKAAIEALRAFPAVNAEIRGTDIVYKDHYDIGVAVGGGKGLVVPVVRDADRLSFAELEKTIGELAVRARDNKLMMKDLEGGTFTISNGGVYGSMLSTPILNPPQSGILGLHNIQKRPVAAGDQIVLRSMMYLALSYDHRLVDGREAVQFLVRVKECVEDPDRIMLEI